MYIHTGIAECGKTSDGLMGVTRMCSVHLKYAYFYKENTSFSSFWEIPYVVSSFGGLSRLTSTLRLRCSKGQPKVSGGIDWSQDNWTENKMFISGA